MKSFTSAIIGIFIAISIGLMILAIITIAVRIPDQAQPQEQIQVRHHAGEQVIIKKTGWKGSIRQHGTYRDKYNVMVSYRDGMDECQVDWFAEDELEFLNK